MIRSPPCFLCVVVVGCSELILRCSCFFMRRAGRRRARDTELSNVAKSPNLQPMNTTITVDVNESSDVDSNTLYIMSSAGMVALSSVALVVNFYMLNCARFLRRPIGVNLMLCVSLTLSNALCAVCYILTFVVNVFAREYFSNCTSMLIEVFKLSTFTASAFNLLALAIIHYIGIVHPLRRNWATSGTVKFAIAIAYLLPISAYLSLFSLIPGGLTAPPFSFFSSDGCMNATIYHSTLFRVALVAPFIFFVLLISFLYMHILIHMRCVARDPLLVSNNNRNKRTNGKLLVTIMLLAGSAGVGWLPTSLNFVMPIIFPISVQARTYLGIIAQTLHVSKLIADAFIYASRLVEVRFAMWTFNKIIYRCFASVLGSGDFTGDMPTEFVRYLSESKENRSMRSKRVKSEFEPDNKCAVKKRVGSERFATDKTKNALTVHRSLGYSQSIATDGFYINRFAQNV